MKTSGFRCETKFGLLVFLGHPNIQYQNDQFDQFLQMTFILSVHPPCVGHLKKLFRTIKIRTGFTGEGQGRSKSPPKNGLNFASGSYSGH